MNIIDRRKFFNKLSLGAVGAILLSFSPMKLLAKKKNNLPDKINIKLHPNSVRRNK